MREQFVTFEIALKLKELGFDEGCLAVYFKNKFQLVKGFNINNVDLHVANEMDAILAPLWQQVIDWFREKYNLLIDSPKLDEWNIGKWSVKITSLDKSIILEEYVGQPYWKIYRCFRTYEEAREQAILKTIELCQKEK